jgi:hypothetical protein
LQPERREARAGGCSEDRPGLPIRRIAAAVLDGPRPNQLDPVNSIDGWSLNGEALDSIQQIVPEHETDPVGPEFMSPTSR